MDDLSKKALTLHLCLANSTRLDLWTVADASAALKALNQECKAQLRQEKKILKLESRLNPSNTPAQTTMDERTAIKGKIALDGLTAIKDLVANNCKINEPSPNHKSSGNTLADEPATPAIAQRENVGHTPATEAMGITPTSTCNNPASTWRESKGHTLPADGNTLVNQANSDIHQNFNTSNTPMSALRAYFGYTPTNGAMGITPASACNTPASTWRTSKGQTLPADSNTLVNQANSYIHQNFNTSNTPMSALRAHFRHTPASGKQDNSAACGTDQANDNIPTFGGTATNYRSVFIV